MKKNYIARLKNKIFTPFFEKKFGLNNMSFNDSVSVVMFHKISNKTNVAEKFVCNENDFKMYLASIKNTVGFITPDKLFEINKGVLLTFDDATEDLFIVVYPILKKLEIPFVVFVTTGFIGKTGYINEDQLAELNNYPSCFIGAHTISHPKLRFSNEADKEIEESINNLESIINKPVDLFAYPYGSIFACSRKNVKCVSKTKVDYAFSTIPGYINAYAKKHKYFLPRFNGDKLVKEFKMRKTI